MAYSRPSHTELIRTGEAQTEFNSNQLTIFRIDAIQRYITQVRQFLTPEGLQSWLFFVQDMDTYLEGLLRPDEQEDLRVARGARAVGAGADHLLVVGEVGDLLGEVLLEPGKEGTGAGDGLEGGEGLFVTGVGEGLVRDFGE